MPWSAPKHCPAGHPPYHGRRCPVCAAASKSAADARRPSARVRGYDTKWERECRLYLAANPKCYRCGAPSKVVDHVIPHKGDKYLFWARTNWQALCVTCHSGAKQSQERRDRGVVADFGEGRQDRRGRLARNSAKNCTS